MENWTFRLSKFNDTIFDKTFTLNIYKGRKSYSEILPLNESIKDIILSKFKILNIGKKDTVRFIYFTDALYGDNIIAEQLIKQLDNFKL